MSSMLCCENRNCPCLRCRLLVVVLDILEYSPVSQRPREGGNPITASLLCCKTNVDAVAAVDDDTLFRLGWRCGDNTTSVPPTLEAIELVRPNGGRCLALGRLASSDDCFDDDSCCGCCRAVDRDGVAVGGGGGGIELHPVAELAVLSMGGGEGKAELKWPSS